MTRMAIQALKFIARTMQPGSARAIRALLEISGVGSGLLRLETILDLLA